MMWKSQTKEQREKIAQDELKINKTWGSFIEARKIYNYFSCSALAREFLNLSRELRKWKEEQGLQPTLDDFKGNTKEFDLWKEMFDRLEERIIVAEQTRNWGSF